MFTWKYKSDECVKDLIHKATQLLQLLSSKGCRFKKWISNSQIILDQLHSTNLEIKRKTKDLTLKTILKRY